MQEIVALLLILGISAVFLFFYTWIGRDWSESGRLKTRRNTYISLLAIIISILISFVLSSFANIPSGAGLGGLMWIFGPFMVGIVTIILYLIFIALNERGNRVFGLSLSIINIVFGIYMHFSGSS
jgi:hypothetical protein